jgi:hypothetical protein
MSYTNRLIAYAKKLDQVLSVQRSEDTFKYKVDIDKVFYKDNHLRQNIFGIGFTIEDACMDYLRKAHGGQLIHYITDAIVDII